MTEGTTAVIPEYLRRKAESVAGTSLTANAWRRLRRGRFAMASLWIVGLYGLVAALAKLGIIAANWNVEIGPRYLPPSLSSLPLIFGTDIFGHSVFLKVIQGTRIAMSVGLVTSLISVPVGIFFGSLAGYFGKWVDELVVWFYTVLSSIPSIILLIAIAYVMGRGITAVYVALGVTSWVGLARVLRGEFIKHKAREYVIAAESIGASHTSRIFKHILPNLFHFVIINVSIQFVSAIKSEVILSFLGLGVQGQPSWGIMIDDAKLEIQRGVWWQLAGATLGMFIIVLALNILGDALRDAFDPKSA